MQVLIVSCVYPPEPVISARTSASLAYELTKRGDDVRVVTGYPNRPGGKLFPGYRRRLYYWETSTAGFRILRCFNAFSKESSLVSRFLENTIFGITSGLAVLSMQRPDVIYANTWPIFATGILWMVSRLRGIPLVVSIQDVYPESLVSQGRIQPAGWLTSLLRWFDGVIARGSHAVIVLSERFASIFRIVRRLPIEKIHVIPNWTDNRPRDIPPNGELIRKKYKLPKDCFLLIYAGNIGAAAGVETLLEAFTHLREYDNLHLLVAGEGSKLDHCRKLVDQIGLRRVIFHAPWLPEETEAVLSAADLLLLPTRGKQSLVSTPSKLIHYMLAGKPVLASALPDSDMADIICQSDCGWIVTPDSPEELADAIRLAIQLDSAELTRLGNAGRDYALTHFTADTCLPQVIHLLEQASLSKP